MATTMHRSKELHAAVMEQLQQTHAPTLLLQLPQLISFIRTHNLVQCGNEGTVDRKRWKRWHSQILTLVGGGVSTSSQQQSIKYPSQNSTTTPPTQQELQRNLAIFQYVGMRLLAETIGSPVSRLHFECLALHCNPWINLIVKHLMQEGEFQGVHCASGTTLGLLVREICRYQELKREMLPSIVKALKALLHRLQKCIETKLDVGELLMGTSLCVRVLSTAAKSQLETIKQLSFVALESEHSDTREAAATCLVQCGVYGPGGDSTRIMSTALHQLNLLIDPYCAYDSRLYAVQLMGDGTTLPNDWPTRMLPDYDWSIVSTFRRRFEGLCNCIQKCLTIPAFILLPVDALLVTIYRLISLSTVQDYKGESIAHITPAEVFSLGPIMCTRALGLLSSLVLCSGRHLVPHWREVGTILEQGLVDMLKEDDSAGGIWGTTSARVALFRCISKCFEVLGSALWTEYSAPLLALLLQYLVSCRPPPIHDNLHMAYQVGSKKRKKKRKAEGTAPKDNTAKSSSGSTTGACIEVMAASVYAVEAILKQPGSSLLPPKSLYLVETTVISLLKTIQKSLGTESGGGAAWDNPAGDLRLALYKLLVTRAISGAAREESEEGHGIGGGTGAGGRGGFLLAAAAAFEEGQKSDPNLGIADFCGRCLNACEVVIHPRLPPHLAPAPLPPLHSRMLATGVVESSVPSSWSPEELLASFFSAAATTSHKRSWIGGDPVTTSRHRTPAPLSINNNNSKLAHSATTSYDMTNRAKEKESETDRDKERTKEVERATEREKARSSGSGNKGKNDPMVVDQKRASHVRHHAEDGVRPLLLKLLHGEEDRKGQTPEVMQVESATPVPSQATKSAEGEEGRAEEEEDNHVRYDKWSVKEVPSFSPAAEEGGPSTTMVIVEKRSQSAGGGTVGEKNITKKHGAEEEEGDEDIPDIVDASPDTSDDEGKGL